MAALDDTGISPKVLLFFPRSPPLAALQVTDCAGANRFPTTTHRPGFGM